MTLSRVLIFLLPAACLLAQTPPPAPKPVPPSAQPAAAPAPKAPDAPPAVPPNKVILTVGDVSVTAAQFDAIIDVLPEQIRAQARGPARTQFAQNVARVIVLAKEGKRLKLDEAPTYKTQAEFQDENILAGLAYAQIVKDNKPSEEELRKYYDEHKSLFEQVHASHILIRFQGSSLPIKAGQKDLTDAEALAKAQALRQKIQGGEDFAKLATQESDDAGSAAKGGDLGTFRHGQMVPSFEEAAFALKPGEVSQPVKTQFGYHVIKVESKDIKSFEDVRPELERQLGPLQAQKAVDDLLKKTPTVLDFEFFPRPDAK
jgi:parvulin-like peptidyl-prolyl isomerase